MRSQVAAAVVVLAVASGCGSGSVTKTAVGQVADISTDRVCLTTGTGPIGICYQSARGQLTGIRIGQCVRVTATLKYGRLITRELTSIEPVSAEDHPDECPAA